MVLMSEYSALELGLKPLARILGHGDAAQDPVDFTTSPSLAIPIAARNAGIDICDIEYHEINEAFSVVVSSNYLHQGYYVIHCTILSENVSPAFSYCRHLQI